MQSMLTPGWALHSFPATTTCLWAEKPFKRAKSTWRASWTLVFLDYRLFLENCAQLFGQKFFECRLIAACQLSAKADKFESRFAVISKFRLFTIHGKNPHSFKVERVFNLLALRSLILHNEKEVIVDDLQNLFQPFKLTILYEDKPKSTSKFVYRSEDVLPVDFARELLVGFYGILVVMFCSFRQHSNITSRISALLCPSLCRFSPKSY